MMAIGTRGTKELPVQQKKPDREEKERSHWGFRGMTVRDWLQMLIVPLVLVGIGFLFDTQQDARQQEVEEQRAQDTALQAYLDQMSLLMLEKDLHDSEAGSDVRTLARARTLTVLRRLDGTRKGSVVQFLAESDLIVKDSSVLDLAGADLREVILNDADLSGTELSGLDFNPPPYDGPAQLFGTNLSDADLSHAILGGADLSGADLSNALLQDTFLYDPRFPEDAADLSGVDLSDAYLEGAKVTEEQLEQASSLEGATMPNGQKYEDWIKDHHGHEEDG